MPRPTSKKPRNKGPRQDQPNGELTETAAVDVAVAEPSSDELQPPTMPVEAVEPEKEEQRPAQKDRDKEKENKDRIAPTSLNIAKLQAMSMGDLNQMAREL